MTEQELWDEFNAGLMAANSALTIGSQEAQAQWKGAGVALWAIRKIHKNNNGSFGRACETHSPGTTQQERSDLMAWAKLTDEQRALVKDSRATTIQTLLVAYRNKSKEAAYNNVVNDQPIAPQSKHQSRTSWKPIARRHGVLGNNAGGNQEKELKAKLVAIDPLIEFNKRGADAPMAERLDRACRQLAAQRAGATPVEAARAAVPAAELSQSADAKLQSAIRAHIRVLDLEFEERVHVQVRIELEPLLKIYNANYERHDQVVRAYKGIYSVSEYRSIIGALHVDRYPGIDPVGAARLNKAFGLINDKQFELCGNAEPELSGSMPKTVEDLLKMRKGVL